MTLREPMLATLSSGFAAIALLLSIVGPDGVMSFVRTRLEFGCHLGPGGSPICDLSFGTR